MSDESDFDCTPIDAYQVMVQQMQIHIDQAVDEKRALSAENIELKNEILRLKTEIDRLLRIDE